MKPIFKLLFFLLLLCSMVLLQNCKDTDDTPPKNSPPPKPYTPPCDTCLPPITTTGAGTFGCRVNGKVWLPKETWSYPATYLELYSSSYSNIVGIVGRDYSDNPQSISLYVAPITDTGMFYFADNTLSYSWGQYSNKHQYLAETITKGYVHILRIDRENGIASGTFEFDVYDKYNQSNGDTIHITDGRFDISK